MHDDRPLDSRKILIRQLCWCVGFGMGGEILQFCEILNISFPSNAMTTGFVWHLGVYGDRYR